MLLNSSSISIDRFIPFVRKPDRFIGIHFFNPASYMKLVEIIPSHLTSYTVKKISYGEMLSWGKYPVVCKSTPGFIVNRVARPFYLEAFRLVDEGYSDPEVIDEALKKCGQFKMGPFELTDLIGQDVNYQVTENIWQGIGLDAKYTPSIFQKSLVDSNLLGRKQLEVFINIPYYKTKNPLRILTQ